MYTCTLSYFKFENKATRLEEKIYYINTIQEPNEPRPQQWLAPFRFKHFGNILVVHGSNPSRCPNIKQHFLISSGMVTFPSPSSSPTLCKTHIFNTPSSFCTWSLMKALKGETTITTESCPIAASNVIEHRG